MKMSKSHFEALARALRETKLEGLHSEQGATSARAQWELTVQKIADVCAVSNVSFKRSAFYDACGYER